MASPELTLLVFSPVRWNVSFQRPQQLVSRLAHRHRVIYVEEPLPCAGPRRVERVQQSDGVRVLRPLGDMAAPGWSSGQIDAWRSLLATAVEEDVEGDLVAWFCTPSALPLIDGLPTRLVVYDCMDPPAPHASPLGADAALLDAADLVLAAGPGLWGAKRLRHSNAHCVPSSTDAARFAPARVTARCEEYLTAERLQGHILAPRLGHAGIIDDSVDLELLDAAAQRRPDWHFVLAGPVARSGGAVPQRGNIHWLGDQPGIRLPALVAAWDVCLMPYDVGERTRYLCPAHALEYLAAEKPVVSTALPDVSSLFGGVVRVAQDADGFIAACDEALRETPEQRAERLVKSAGCVGRFSWDEAARTVQRLLDDTLARTRRSRQPASPPRLRAATVSAA